MDNAELAALIATFIVAHGAATLTVLWKGITMGIKKLIEWERLCARVDTLEQELEKTKTEWTDNNAKLKKDIDAAFAKLRA